MITRAAIRQPSTAAAVEYCGLLEGGNCSTGPVRRWGRRAALHSPKILRQDVL